MGCGSCGGNQPAPMFSNVPKANQHQDTIKGVLKNLGRAATSQNSKLQWFKDGLSGLIKCLNVKQEYSDEQIKANRSICLGCEYSTKRDNGELFPQSQCMAPDPVKDGAACGCFITCKSMVDKCPLDKWTPTPLTVEKKDLGV